MQTPFSSDWARTRKIRSQCAILEGLSDRQLKDIGIRRQNIQNVSEEITKDD
ncbi:MAG: DUF1127 domain-containing protein [Pseudomonadota bacterium]